MPLSAQVPSQLHPDSSIQIRANSQEKIGDLYRLSGQVEITYGEMRIGADQAEYDAATGQIIATGNVRYFRETQQEDIQASRAEYNLRTESGSFFDVRGSIGATVRVGPSLLTTSNPFYFEAERVDREDGGAFLLHNAQITVCSMPDPDWTFSSSRAAVVPGAGAWVYHGTFRFLRVPVFYFPFLFRSLRRIPRSTGFLMPTLGNNSRLGTVFGDSFYWAINRSTDAELGAEWLSKRGWSQQATFRMRPVQDTYLNVSYLGVVDRGLGPQKVDQGGRTARVVGVTHLPAGVRGVVDFNYLSSLTFREAFAQTYSEAVNSEIHSAGYLSRNFDSFQWNLLLSRFENYQSIRPKDTVSIRHLPEMEFNSVERPLWPNAPAWFSWNSTAGVVSRSDPAGEDGRRIRTSLLERFVVSPRLTIPLAWNRFRLTSVLGYRGSHYGARQEEGRITGEAFQRSVEELSVELVPPSLSRVFAGAGSLYAQPFKHVIEPKATFRYVNGVRDFGQTLLFDEHDLVTNTKHLEYSLTNRLLAKREAGLAAQEVFSWEVKQQYYFDPDFGGALVPGRRNVFASSLALSGNAYLDEPRRFSPIVSNVRFRPFQHYELEVRNDYDLTRHRFTHGALVGNARWGDAFVSASHSFSRSSAVLASPSNQVAFSLGYGQLTRAGWNAVFAGTYDVRSGFLQFTAFQGSYNTDCWGISVEFRRFALGPARNENQFRLAFSLANVGTFGNLKKQERLF